MGIFAEEDIPVGQEITFDYQFERFGGKKQKCFCGETNCRGFHGAKPKKLLHQRRVESCLLSFSLDVVAVILNCSLCSLSLSHAPTCRKNTRHGPSAGRAAM